MATLEERPATFFELHGVIAETPALRRRLLEQRDGWRAAFAEELAARRAPRKGLASELLATAAVGAFDVATETWARTAGRRRRLSRLLDDAFDRLGSGLA